MPLKRFSIFRLIINWVKRTIDKIILWITAKSFALILTIFLSLFTRSRMSHNNGIAALGKVKVVDNPQFPAHSFFKAGRVFPVRIRHASAAFLDDAMNSIRSMSIKFSHHHFKSPFDLEMNTGAISLFWTATSFLKFGKWRKEKWGVEYVNYMRHYPDGYQGAVESIRRHASSFHNLHFNSKTPFLFIGDDEIKRYAKYRVLPDDDEKESGIDTNPSFWDMSNQRVLPHETRGRNYLKDEYENRVRTTNPKYRLQIQTRIANDDDSPEIFNNMIPWKKEIYPWVDLAIIEIEKTLDWKESTLTSFSVNNMPKTLGIIPAKSVFDYNSVNYLRAHSEIARKARLFALKVFGMVPQIPDNDNRNVSEWGV